MPRSKWNIYERMKKKAERFKDRRRFPVTRVSFVEEESPGWKRLTGRVKANKKTVYSLLTPVEKAGVTRDIKKGEIEVKKGAFGEEIKTGFVSIDLNGKQAEIVLFTPFEEITPGLKSPEKMKLRGEGEKIFLDTLNELKKRGIKSVVVKARPEVSGFYEKYGFKKYNNKDGFFYLKKRI